ncbi:UDP-glycosyltransferase UGT5-like [Daktulosphaira vitifoliae]|uniref:UDP-glycosyltransferase UGT5-like n=1 Tax=Daktulosphaira vitifoliae TaxID=58002 RepID=UPI0021AAB28C|nr:UDP-glycosyltransferase UGT5-like [Daktulosphaira vitifoliae]
MRILRFYLIIAAICVIQTYSKTAARTQTSNILGFFPSGMKSHFMGFKYFLETLVNKGHNLTLISFYPLDEAKYPYRHIALDLKKWNIEPPGGSMLNFAKVLNLIMTPIQICWFGPFITEISLNETVVKNFIANDQTSFDLVIFENFYHEAFVALGHKYNAPVVQLLPFAATARVSQWHSNPYNPSYITDVTSSFPSNMTFVQRTINTVYVFMYTVVNRITYFPRQEKIMNKYMIYPGHENRPSLAELLRNISLTLINTHPVIGYPFPMVPSYIHVAGMHCKPPKELPEDLKTIMETAEKGVVYFSLGSVIRSSDMPKDTQSMLLSELSKIEQIVLWKWEADDLPQLPKNVIIRKWFPQNDILGHPKCKLFITHGGVHSTIEAINYAVPMLSIPIFGDQGGNSLRAEIQGIALQVPYSSLTHQAFGDALHKLLNNPSYAENAKKISITFKDEPLTQLEKAIFWVEYVMRHKGAAHLRTSANELYWFQYLLLDIIFVVLSILMLLCYTIKKIFVKTCKNCFKRKTTINKKKQ